MVAGRDFDLSQNSAWPAQSMLKPWQQEIWCISETCAHEATSIENVLYLYEQSNDPLQPQICYDEYRLALIDKN